MKATARRPRWFRPPPRRAIPTRAGLFVLASPLVLGVAAVSASNNLLFMLLAAAMVVVVVSGVLSERNMRGVSVAVRPVDAVYAGEAAVLEVAYSRPVRMADTPAFGLIVRESPQGIWPPWRVSDLKSPKILDAQLPVLEGRHGRVVARRTFTTRGPAQLDACELVTTYPFSLLNKARDLPVTMEVIVRPRRIPCPPELQDPRGLQIEGDAEDERGHGLELYGLRERQVWDSVHRIHALRSLAVGQEVVLELAGAEQPAAWLGVASGPKMDDEAWERTLEVAQAILTAWHRAGYAPGLTVGATRFPPGQVGPDSLQDALARAEPATFRPDGPGLWLLPVGVTAPPGATKTVTIDGAGRVEVSS
ncbi:MAG: hypothetical protein AAFN74_05770 [Myxococcota bacterium]